MRHLSQKEIYEMAQQLLLGEKTWEDFEWLEDDDRSRIQVIVKRGVKALAEQKERQGVPDHLIKKAANTKLASGYIYIPKRHKARFLSEAKGIRFRPFPIGEILKQEPSIRRRFIEQLNRKMTPEEMGIWLKELEPQNWERLQADLTPGLKEDFSYRLEKVGDEVAPYEKEASEAKYSITAVTFLKDCSGLTSESKRMVQDYHQELEEQLAKYCVALPEKMGVLSHLRRFTNHQWTKLAGFTPRREMSQMVDFLPDDVVARLLDPLPSVQKEDVNQLAARLAEDRQDNPRAYAETISSFKRWGSVVNKVVALSLESSQGSGT